MTKKLEFYGHSDDVFVAGGDEFYSSEVLVTSSVGDLIVSAYYLDNACWAIGIAPADEDKEMPSWPISYRQSKYGYSTVLTIEAPDDAKVTVYE